MKAYEKIFNELIKYSEAFGAVKLFDINGDETKELEKIRRLLIMPNNWIVSFDEINLKFNIYVPKIDPKFLKWLKITKNLILSFNYNYNIKVLWKKERKLKEMREDFLIQKEKYEKEKKLLAKYLYKILQLTTVDKLIEVLRRMNNAFQSKNGKKIIVDVVSEKDDMKFDLENYSDSERKLAKILRLLDLASGGYPERKEDAKPVEYLVQARRILNKSISGRKIPVPYSENPHSQKALFYSTIAEALTNINDIIVANIASRLSDYYEALAGGRKTDLDEKYLSNLEKLVQSVANMIGIKFPERNANDFLNEYKKWLENFSIDKIIEDSTDVKNDVNSKTEEYHVEVGGKKYDVVVKEMTEEEKNSKKFAGGQLHFMNFHYDKIKDNMVLKNYLRDEARKILEKIGFPPKEIGDLPEMKHEYLTFVIDYPFHIYVSEKVVGPLKSIPAEKRLSEEILRGDREFFSQIVTEMIREKNNPLRLRRITSFLSEKQILRLMNVIKNDIRKKTANMICSSIMENLTKNNRNLLKECSCGCKCPNDPSCKCNCDFCSSSRSHEEYVDDLKMDPIKFVTLKNYPKNVLEQKQFLTQLEFNKGASVASQAERLFANNPLSTCDIKSLKMIANFANMYGYKDMANELEDYINAVDRNNEYNYAENLTFEGTIDNPIDIISEVKNRYGIYIAEQCLELMNGFPSNEQNRKALELIYDVALDKKEVDFSNFLRKAIGL